MPFLQLENEALNSVFWVFYFTLLIGVLFFILRRIKLEIFDFLPVSVVSLNTAEITFCYKF